MHLTLVGVGFGVGRDLDRLRQEHTMGTTGRDHQGGNVLSPRK